jgi:hypothetical protein
MYMVDRPETGKTDLIRLEIFMYPDKPASVPKYSQHVDIFKDRCTEVWIKRKIG